MVTLSKITSFLATAAVVAAMEDHLQVYTLLPGGEVVPKDKERFPDLGIGATTSYTTVTTSCTTFTVATSFVKPTDYIVPAAAQSTGASVACLSGSGLAAAVGPVMFLLIQLGIHMGFM